MIEFACPGCTKPHEANRAFAGFDTRCLRCGTLMVVPGESGRTPDVLAGAQLPRPSRPAPLPRPAPAPKPAAGDLSLDLPLPAEPPRTRRVVPAEAVVDDEPVKAAPRRTRKSVLVGAAVVVAAAAGVSAFAFGDKPKPSTSAAPAPAPKREEPKPAPPPPKEPPPLPPAEVAPLPRAARPPVEYERTAAALLTEHAEAPAATDQLYAGKGVVVRGVFHQYKLGTLTLVAGPSTAPGPNTAGPNTPALTADLALPDPADPGAPLLVDPQLAPGQAVTVRGTYTAGCKLAGCTVESTEAPADREFLGKSVCLEGATVRAVNPPTGAVPVPSLVLDPPVTDAAVTVTCYFKLSDREQLDRLKPGDRVDVRGRCSGRSYAAVRLDSCALVPPGGVADGCVQVPAGAFFLEYEADLAAGPRVNPGDPGVEALPVTAGGLAGAFQADLRGANATYRYRVVQLTGTVLRRQDDARTLILETGTDSRYQVAVVFTAARFAAVPPEEKELVVRGTCSGVWNGSFVRIDSGEAAPADPTAPHTHVDFFPYRPGVEYQYEYLQRVRPKDNPIARLKVWYAGDDLIQTRQVRVGTFPSTTLFSEVPRAPRWTVETKNMLAVRRYRIADGKVEIGQVVPAEAGAKKEPQVYWEPVLKIGLKAGQSWSANPPDGRLATYTVVGFSRDAAGRDLVEVRKTLRNPGDPARWEETSATYARGVGEVRRVVTSRTDKGEAFVSSETKLVGDGSRPAELKTDPKK